MDTYNLLVIDDDPNIRRLLAELLATRPEFHLLIAANGKEAVRQFAENRIDLVLTDIHMPGFTGLELMADMKKINFKPEIMVMTANATPENVETARRLGARSVILKPFDDLEVIESEINKALRVVKAARPRPNGDGNGDGLPQPVAARPPAPAAPEPRAVPAPPPAAVAPPAPRAPQTPPAKPAAWSAPKQDLWPARKPPAPIAVAPPATRAAALSWDIPLARSYPGSARGDSKSARGGRRTSRSAAGRPPGGRAPAGAAAGTGRARRSGAPRGRPPGRAPGASRPRARRLP